MFIPKCHGKPMRIVLIFLFAILLFPPGTSSGAEPFDYDRCTPFGPGQYSASIFVDPLGDPHVAWEQILDNGISSDGEFCRQNDIYYTYSTDQGASFAEATADIDRIPWVQARVSMAIAPDGNPGVVWVDHREGEKYVYFSRSADGGATFSPGVRVEPALSRRQDRPFLLFDSQGNPFVAWIDFYYQCSHMNPVGYIRVSRSLDGGASFEPSVSICPSSRPYQGWPSFILDSHDNPMVTVHYWNTRAKHWNVYFTRSTDKGQTFSYPVLVETTSHHQAVAGKHAMVVDSSDNPIIAITDKRTGYWNIRVVRSIDGGNSFLGSIAVDAYPTQQVTPSLGIDADDNLYVVWSDERNGQQNIRFSMSDDGGYTFRQSVFLDQQVTLQNRPSLEVNSDLGVVHIEWADRRQRRSFVYYTKSMDGGETFSAPISVYPYPLD